MSAARFPDLVGELYGAKLEPLNIGNRREVGYDGASFYELVAVANPLAR